MVTIRRTAASLVLAFGVFLGGLSVSFADYETIIHDWSRAQQHA